MDMTKTIEPKSDQLNADDMISGPRTITVTRVTANPSSAEQPVSVFFDGDNGKPWKPCKSTRRILVAVWGKDASQYVGRSLTLYRDPDVTWGGLKVGGIRISHMSHIDAPMTLAITASRTVRKPVTIKPLSVTAREHDPMDAARQAARGGSDALGKWWKENPNHRDAAKAIMSELASLRDAADAAKVPPDDDLPM
jgi:hypothetical protein